MTTRRPRRSWGRRAILVVLAAQLVCTVFFVSDILLTVVGLRSDPVAWQTRELLEIGAALGLILGVVLGGIILSDTYARARRSEARLEAATAAFMDVVEERFSDWGLTPAEKDVALFAIKGMSTAEIAELRNTSEGTVKAQSAAVYRKAGVSGRAQLVSLFMEELVAIPEREASQPISLSA